MTVVSLDIMSFDQIIAYLDMHFDDVIITKDDDGELVIHTGLYQDNDGVITDKAPDTE